MSTFRYPTRCAALLGLCLPCAALAQTTPTPADTARAYKHHLGLTASPVLEGFFRNNRSLPLGLLYKRQLTPAKALRLRLVGLFSRRDTANYPGTFPGPFFPGFKEGTYSQVVRVNAYVGYDGQQELSRRWGWSYGAEVGAGWSRIVDHQVFDTFPNNSFVNHNIFIKTTTVWEGQGRPYLGIHYHVSKRLRVFAESAVLLTYQYRKDDRDNSGTPPFGQIFTYDKSKSFSFLWKPVQLIGTSVSF